MLHVHMLHFDSGQSISGCSETTSVPLGPSLGEEVKNEVSTTSKFNLRLRASRVLIKVLNFHRKNGQTFLINNDITSLLASFDEATNGPVRKIESLVKEKLSRETYKLLLLNNLMYINVPSVHASANQP